MSNVICHYGIRGMKWGVRRNKKQGPKMSDDYSRYKSLKKKKTKQLTNSELKEINNRMQLENQYSNLKKQRISFGEKFVRDVAYDAVKNTTSEYARKYSKVGAKFIADQFMRKAR